MRADQKFASARGLESSSLAQQQRKSWEGSVTTPRGESWGTLSSLSEPERGEGSVDDIATMLLLLSLLSWAVLAIRGLAASPAPSCASASACARHMTGSLQACTLAAVGQTCNARHRHCTKSWGPWGLCATAGFAAFGSACIAMVA